MPDPLAEWTKWLVVCTSIIGFLQVCLLAYHAIHLSRIGQAAESAAKDANASTKVAHDALHSVERPWIVFGATLSKGSDSRVLEANWTIANCGRTPALVQYAGAEFFTSNEIPIADSYLKRLREEQGKSVIGPGKELMRPVANLESETMLPGGPRLFLVAVVRYLNVLNETRLHETSTIWEFERSIGNFVLIDAPEFNCYS